MGLDTIDASRRTIACNVGNIVRSIGIIYSKIGMRKNHISSYPGFLSPNVAFSLDVCPVTQKKTGQSVGVISPVESKVSY